MSENVRIHPTAQVSPQAKIGVGSSIWHQAQVREGVRLGRNCIVGKGAYIDFGVQIGDNVKIQNYVSVYHGVEIEDGVFVGPHVCFTNDNLPRAVNPDGSLKAADDWELGRVLVKRGAALGANSTILPKVVVGEWALVGAGSVVTKDVPAHGIVVGNPARLIGFACACGARLERNGEQGNGRAGERRSRGAEGKGEMVVLQCQKCGGKVKVRKADWEKVQ